MRSPLNSLALYFRTLIGEWLATDLNVDIFFDVFIAQCLNRNGVN